MYSKFQLGLILVWIYIAVIKQYDQKQLGEDLAYISTS